MTEKAIIFGLGAQTKYILENLAVSGKYKVIGIITKKVAESMEKELCKIPIHIWDEELINQWKKKGIGHAVVAHSDNRQKADLAEIVCKMGFKLINAIHPSASIATSAQIGDNVIVNAKACIQPFARIGNGVMIHAGVIVEHDNIIEDYVNLAPNTTLAGWVHVQEGAYLFTNVTVIPQKKIGKHAIIGAGSVLLHDVPDYALAVGNPARIVRNLSPDEMKERR